jgi:hypothetical protein
LGIAKSRALAVLSAAVAHLLASATPQDLEVRPVASLLIPMLRELSDAGAKPLSTTAGNANFSIGEELKSKSALHFAYRIAGISFGIASDGGVGVTLDPESRDFAVHPEFSSEICDVNIGVSCVDKLPLPTRQPLFHSGGLWSLFEERVDNREGFRLNFQRPFPGEIPYKSAWFDRNFETGHLLLSRQFFPDDRPIYPLEYPLDEVLMIHHLACGYGLEAHAVGIVDEIGRGHLFLGHSGAGKSTTARLWLNQPGVQILSDDRIILRAHGEKIFMYGTPWHGDAGISSPDCAAVTNIYFLEQYRHNEIVALAPGVAAGELFARSFVPRHCGQGLDFSLGFIERVTRQIPCNIFRFVPRQSAVEAIRCAQD